MGGLSIIGKSSEIIKDREAPPLDGKNGEIFMIDGIDQDIGGEFKGLDGLSNGSEELIKDDFGLCISEDGRNLTPNNSFDFFGINFKVDEKGNVCCINGENLFPSDKQTEKDNIIDSESNVEKSGEQKNESIDDKSSNVDENTNEDESKENEDETKENEDLEKEKMEPPVVVKFTCKDGYDKDEYERQVKNQEKGMNNISLADYKKNRERYSAEGRDTEEGKEAQDKARQEARADKIAELRQQGMSREEAEEKADEWLKNQAALHDPDQVAGGNPENVTGVGDKDINSSIGAQWRDRIHAVDEAVDEYIKNNNLKEEDMQNIYLNVILEVNYE